jgi:hypothetical protein
MTTPTVGSGLGVAEVPSSLALAAAGGLPLAALDGLKQRLLVGVNLHGLLTEVRSVPKTGFLLEADGAWLKEHAWKLNLLARADAHQIPPTQFRFNDFRNIDVRRRVPVNDGVAPGFQGVCDTVLTQKRLSLRSASTEAP